MGNVEEFTVEENGRTRRILIPGAKDMDRNQYQEIVEWQTEKTKRELREPREERKHSKEEVAGALREYNNWRHKYQGTKRYF